MQPTAKISTKDLQRTPCNHWYFEVSRRTFWWELFNHCLVSCYEARNRRVDMRDKIAQT